MGLSSLIKDGACAPSIGSTEMPEKSHYFKKLVKIHIFPGGSDGKASAYNVGDLGSIPGLGKDLLEKGMATHSSILAPSPKKGAQRNTHYYI